MKVCKKCPDKNCDCFICDYCTKNSASSIPSEKPKTPNAIDEKDPRVTAIINKKCCLSYLRDKDLIKLYQVVRNELRIRRKRVNPENPNKKTKSKVARANQSHKRLSKLKNKKIYGNSN